MFLPRRGNTTTMNRRTHELQQKNFITHPASTKSNSAPGRNPVHKRVQMEARIVPRAQIRTQPLGFGSMPGAGQNAWEGRQKAEMSGPLVKGRWPRPVSNDQAKAPERTCHVWRPPGNEVPGTCQLLTCLPVGFCVPSRTPQVST